MTLDDLIKKYKSIGRLIHAPKIKKAGVLQNRLSLMKQKNIRSKLIISFFKKEFGFEYQGAGIT